ncbi:MAG: maleylpyruvate isomerase family mycothiol-dependent enzyme [Actinomycetota bacterium]
MDALDRAAGRVLELAPEADLSTPVPHLGRWKVRDLIAHLGGVHEWAARIVTTRSMEGPGATKSALDGPELCEWCAAAYHGLREALSTNPVDDPCPNFNPGSERTVGWWLRRQTHETTVHAWDLERALGGATTEIEPDVAADGVDEFLDVFVRTRGKRTLVAPLTLAVTDPARTWTLTLADRPGRLEVAPDGPEAGTALIGPAHAMVLVLWGRLTVAEAGLAVQGDPEVVRSFRP